MLPKLNGYLLIFIFLSFIVSACSESVFISGVKEISAPEKTEELDMERIKCDEIYSEYIAVYDSLIISSCPNAQDYFFYVADLNNNKLLGSFMKKGQGPKEYLSLAPIRRIEKKGDDICALTYEPTRRELLEWNISESIATGKDSVVSLGFYEEPGDGLSLTYNGIYMIGNNKYIGYLQGYFLKNKNIQDLPKYWILKGEKAVPEEEISFVKRKIENDQSIIAPHSLFASVWSINPDNSKIVNAMKWLEQINIMDIKTGNSDSYRVKGSPGEGIFKTRMEDSKLQYEDVVCNQNSIYALYIGSEPSKYEKGMDGQWIHEYDWNGDFIAKYHLQNPIVSLWLDSSSGILYGYDASDDALYRMKIH